MTLTEKKQNLFDNTKDCWYAHCISADFALGAGIAVQFDKKYNMREKLLGGGYHNIHYPETIIVD